MKAQENLLQHAVKVLKAVYPLIILCGIYVFINIITTLAVIPTVFKRL